MRYSVSDGMTTTERTANTFVDVGVQVEADVGGSLALFVTDEAGESRWVWWMFEDDSIHVSDAPSMVPPQIRHGA